MKEPRHNAQAHDVRRLVCSPPASKATVVVRAGHAALDGALARSAARGAQSPMGQLRAARRTPFTAPSAALPATPASMGRPVQLLSTTPSRHVREVVVVHAATSTTARTARGQLEIRHWHRISDASAN